MLQGSGRRIVVPLLFTWAVFIGGGFYGIYDVRLRILSLALAGIGLATWMALGRGRQEGMPRSVLSPALAVALASFALSLATSRQPRVGIEYLAWATVLSGLYLLLVRLNAHSATRLVIGQVTVALFVTLATLYLAVVSLHWVEFWTLVGRITAPPLRPLAESLTFGNPSAVMTVSTLLLAASVAAIGIDTPVRRVAVGLLAALGAVVVVISGSRSGWFGLTIAVAVTGGIWLARSGVSSPSRHRYRRYLRWAPILALAGAAMSSLLLLLAPGILLRAGSGGEQLRAGFWLVAARMFGASPIVESGPGMWVVDRVQYTTPPETDYYIPYAHDLYVQSASEFGVLGIFAGLFAIMLLARLIFAALSSPDGLRRRYAWASLFATIYFGAHQLLDFYANMPAALLAFAIPIAMLDATADGAPFHFRLGLPRRVIQLSWIGATLGAFIVLAWAESSALCLQSANDAFAARSYSDAATAASLAVAIDPTMPANQFALGLGQAALGNKAQAAVAFGTATSVDDLPASWIDLAALRAESGDSSGASDALRHAMRLGYQQPALLVAAAKVSAELGRSDDAITFLTSAVTQAPTLAGDSYWMSDPDLAPLWPKVRGALAQTGIDIQLGTAMALGDAGRARTIANSIENAAAREKAQEDVGAWFGDRALYRQVLDEAESNPLDASAVTWAARLALRYRDPVNAARLERWSDLLSGYGVGGYEVHVHPGTWSGPAAGLTGTFYGQYTYRRPTPPDQLLITLPHLLYEPPSPLP